MNILYQTSHIPSNILALQTVATALHERWYDQGETLLYVRYLLQQLLECSKFQMGTLTSFQDG